MKVYVITCERLLGMVTIASFIDIASQLLNVELTTLKCRQEMKIFNYFGGKEVKRETGWKNPTLHNKRFTHVIIRWDLMKLVVQ